MLFPALKIIENGLFQKFPSGRDSLSVKWLKNVDPFLLTCVCAVISFTIGGDNLDKFVSLGKDLRVLPGVAIQTPYFSWIGGLHPLALYLPWPVSYQGVQDRQGKDV